MAFPKLTRHYLESISTPKIFSRGVNLFENGAAEHIKINKNKIEARVQGSRLYETEAIFNDNGLYFSCSCPYDGESICKHSVALGLAIIEQNLEKEIKFEKKEEKNINEDFPKLVETLPSEKLKEFVIDILTHNPQLADQFKKFAHKENKVRISVSIKKVREEVKSDIESFDLQDYERFYEYQDYKYYVEEWELLQDGATDELNDLFDQYEEAILEYMDDGHIINAFSYLLGVYEGYNAVNYSAIDDPMDILGDFFFDDCKEMYSRILEHFQEKVKACFKTESILKQIIDLLFKEYKKFAKGKISLIEFNLNLFKPFIFELTPTKDLAKYFHERIRKLKIDMSTIGEIGIHLAEKMENNSLWLEIAEESYKNSEQVSQQLLEHYEDDKENFTRIAREVAMKWEGKFAHYCYQILNKENDPQFYADLLKFLYRKEKNIKYYHELKKYFGEKSAQGWFAIFRNENQQDDRYLRLLEAEEKYDEILEIILTGKAEYYFENYVKAIINVYPKEMFDLITRMVNQELKNNLGRGFYRKCANWIKILQGIKESQFNKQLKHYMESLTKTYYNRPAMKDEFKKAGLI